MKESSSPATSRSFAIAIMAAGKGTRLKSRYPKVLHRVGGKSLLEHVISASKHLVPASDIFAIIGHEADLVREAVGQTGVSFVLQAEQRGTGHAVMVAREALASYEHVLILSGDAPLIRAETIKQLRDFHFQHQAAMTILTAVPDDPSGYGRIVRKGDTTSPDVAAIVEQKSATAEQLRIREINSGIYAFNATVLFEHIDEIRTDNPHSEFYLTDMAAILMKAGQRVVAMQASDPCEVLGSNTRAELSQLDSYMRERKAAELMTAGVTIYRPETCVIDSDVTVGADTVIEPFVQLLGATSVGAEAHVRSYSVIDNCSIGDRVTVLNSCVLRDSSVADGAILGPFCQLRPGCEIGENAHVGNFVEMKKTRIGKGSKANHLTYLGDSIIGDRVNVGAGTITCNYDGVHKHQTIIEDGAFIGSDATLVAPVKVGRGSYVAAASCVTEDVPPDALAIGRARQTNKENWARANREKAAATKKK
ncbi:MAG TPA: bifunctional UDP-N-acetylglucosamine diphosphorylase/glucosamine-1-phosphate N-acetyltransferase GlmU [Terriglobales bacterium]|nr:bifunctional UDP-N-acetylglucosamine diphosphorylase/glucosamine-1-phosphate N-acetyltransferase GlmU [Terriglobales bacterium]